MKCQHCEKPATFHITELTNPDGPQVVHLCEEHVREYLSGDKNPANPVYGLVSKQLKLEQSAEQVAKQDKKTCPVCGITFAEFRQAGRLGCPYDYVFFEDDLETLLLNIHNARMHKGKRPSRTTGSPDRQHQLFQLRREMQEAVQKEEYEKASQLRDAIRKLESGETHEPP